MYKIYPMNSVYFLEINIIILLQLYCSTTERNYTIFEISTMHMDLFSSTLSRTRIHWRVIIWRWFRNRWTRCAFSTRVRIVRRRRSAKGPRGRPLRCLQELRPPAGGGSGTQGRHPIQGMPGHARWAFKRDERTHTQTERQSWTNILYNIYFTFQDVGYRAVVKCAAVKHNNSCSSLNVLQVIGCNVCSSGSWRSFHQIHTHGYLKNKSI